jgi:hypothetical protein
MAEETQASEEARPNMQVMLDERELRTSFANGYRIHTTAEEVIIDFGFNLLNPNPQGGQQQMLFKISDRVILSYASVKRLTGSLQQLIMRYEQQFGPISVHPNPVAAGPRPVR